MHKVVFLRHGESVWNRDNLFTGWVDVGLSLRGEKENRQAARLLKKQGFQFDIVFTSVLKRGWRTAEIVLKEMRLTEAPIKKAWELNERHYGALQGLNKKETAKKVGKKQLRIWRRSFATEPPPVDKKSKFYPGNDPKYKNLSEKELPLTESLKDTFDRVVPYWQKEIAPQIKQGKNILVAAHGSSLRALVKYLDNISDKGIEEVNIPTAVPLVYELDKNLKPIKHYYLGEPEKVKKAIKGVANESKI